MTFAFVMTKLDWAGVGAGLLAHAVATAASATATAAKDWTRYAS